MNPRILLFGKNGQVGWQLQRALAPLGVIIAPDSDACDLHDPRALQSTMQAARPHIIVNAAAYTAVDKAEQEQTAAQRINTAAVAEMAEYSRSNDATLVHYSTDYVFDGRQAVAYVESDTANPLSAYGASKHAGDMAVLDSGCRHLIFRCSWIFAARGNNFAKTILRLATERTTLRVVADQCGAPTSAELIADVTAHALRALSANPHLGGLYHLSAAGEASWYDYAKLIIAEARALGAELQVEDLQAISTAEYPLPAQRPQNSRLNTEKLQQAFGLNPPHWQAAVQRLMRELLGK